MTKLKASTPKYRSEVIPGKIDVKSLFHLDVFSCIWDDAGLSSSDGADRWRTDDGIKQGIRALLDRERCREERERLEMEVNRLADWGLQTAMRLCDTFLSLGAFLGSLLSYLIHLSRCRGYRSTSCLSGPCFKIHNSFDEVEHRYGIHEP